MHLYLQTPNGTIQQQVQEGDCVSNLMSQIGFSSANLVLNGEILNQSQLLTELPEEALYFVNLEVLGGKKKKKKKNYTTKKKTKHIHKPVKNQFLNYFEKQNGKLESTRKQCPKCPQFTFLAKHYDRHYCGKCHLTLIVDAETAKANLALLKKKQQSKISQQDSKVDTKADAGKGKKGKKK